MKRLLLLFALCSLLGNLTAAQHKMVPRYNRLTGSWDGYPEVSIKQIQEMPLDSLRKADTLQNTIITRWTLQTSPLNGDTVVVTALVVVPAKVITYTNKGFTLLLADTAAEPDWRGLFARASSDTATHIADGILNVERGDIIRLTGVISEFPTTSMNSATQFQPIPGISIELVGSMEVPPPTPKTAGDFYKGIALGGKVQYSTGEPFEGMVVELTGLTVDSRVNTGRGTFSAVDGAGNQITMYDASRYFTLKGTSVDHPRADSIWTLTYPVVGTRIDTMRGFITTASGSENARGYRISPLYYGDIVFGSILPSLTTHRRYPVVVPSDSAPRVYCKAVAQAPGTHMKSVVLKYSLDHAPFVSDTMVFQPADTTYLATIPQQIENTFVEYFIEGTDSLNNVATMASSAFGGAFSDTSKGFFFYTVLNRPLTIHDIQYTPFLNGRTPYLGAKVVISGIVTADSAQLPITAPSGGTSCWYIQASDQPWNGIWVVGPETTLVAARNGDNITVRGTVGEDYDVTRIQAADSMLVNSIGNLIPPPVPLTTSRFGPSAGVGDPLAEPWEGMLAIFTNVTVTNIYPTFSDITEYEVDDGSGPVLVQQSGKNKYSNVPSDSTLGKTILRVGDKISTLTGVVYYSFNRYKFVPRTNSDFGVITGISEIGNGQIPAQYAMSQNYPNPFNPSTSFQVSLPSHSHLLVTVYNLLGQKVATVVNEDRPAGTYTITWNGASENGRPVTSGVYFVRMQADKFTSVRKVMVVK